MDATLMEPAATWPAASTTAPTLHLEALVAPMSSEHFLAEHWRRKPLHVPAAASGFAPSRFDPILTLADIDTLFAASANHVDDWFFFRASEVVARERYSDAQGQVQLNRINALYREGGTVHLRNVQRYLPAAERCWRALTERFHAQVKLNLWVTSGNELAPYLHFDTHDIFVLQLHGRKHWTLYEHNPALFTPRPLTVALDRRDVGEPAQKLVVEAGDMLYIPAGTPHEVITCDPHSVHLAVGVFPVLWRDVLDAALADLDPRGNAMSAAVPAHLLADEDGLALRSALRGVLLQAVDETRAAALRRHIDTRYLGVLTPPVDGHFVRELLGASGTPPAPLQPGTPLQRRGAAPATVAVDARGERANIRFPGGGELEGPAELAPVLRAVAQAQGMFSAADLPADYDLPSRLLLLTELLQLGLLERAH